MNKLLVTAFEPFDDAVNSSQAVLAELQRRTRDAREQVAFAVMPCRRASIVDAWRGAVAEHEPHAALLLGQAREASGLRLESRAVNELRFRIADLDGAQPQDEPVISDAPLHLPCTLPNLPTLAERIGAKGTPVSVSHDAGRYLCNQLYYLALHGAHEGTGPARVVFVHVPALPTQTVTPPAAPLDAERSANGAELVLRALRDALRNAP